MPFAAECLGFVQIGHAEDDIALVNNDSRMALHAVRPGEHEGIGALLQLFPLCRFDSLLNWAADRSQRGRVKGGTVVRTSPR